MIGEHEGCFRRCADKRVHIFAAWWGLVGLFLFITNIEDY